MDKFAAGPQSLGYIFQVRYALYLILQTSNDLELSIEGLDDIAFEKAGSAKELIQTKHHIKQANVTDASSEIWKTLRIWSARLKKKEIDPIGTRLTLLTTAGCSKDSAAYFLREEDSKTRNPAKAQEILDKIAVGSESQTNKTAYAAYLALDSSERHRLLSNVYVLSDSTNVIDLPLLIKEKLKYTVRPEFQDELFERIEGWWLNRAILAISTGKSILKKEVDSQVYDLVEEYRQDALPIHEFLEALPQVDKMQESDRGFVEQLRLIKIGTTRLTKAISDYYRAFYQRSRWLREGHLQVGELSDYESRLIDEWERIFEAIKEELNTPPTEEHLVKAGKDIYNRIEQQLQLHIRPRATDSFIMRGTYHILSNSGHVGWHPEFRDRLNQIFNRAMEETLGKPQQNL